jgi:hypothetical protein
MVSNAIAASVTKRIVVSRHLFHLASEQARVNRGVASFAAINLLQDAVETFLVAAAEQLLVRVIERIQFGDLFDEIEKASPGSSEFRAGLLRANRMRVQAKHHAVQPDRSEVDESVALAREFLTETSERIFKRPFWSLSLLDEIENLEVRRLLEQAEGSFGEGDYAKTLIHSRCAFYLVFEQRYDAGPFLRNEQSDATWSFLDFSPQHLSPDYHDHVSEPFDYIMVDHAAVQRDLVADGIDPIAFGNVMALTPAVYRHRSNWLVREDASLLDVDNLPARAAYALEHSAEMILRRQARLKAAKHGPSGNVRKLRLRDKGAVVYRKATKQSEVVGPARGLTEPIEADALIPSLEGDRFWRVAVTPNRTFSEAVPGVTPYFYLHADAVEIITDETKPTDS